jgi:hypothetical protein
LLSFDIVQCSPDGIRASAYAKYSVANQLMGLNTVFDANSVRTLCREILGEKNPQRMEELLSDLRTVTKAETEEARKRVRYLV